MFKWRMFSLRVLLSFCLFLVNFSLVLLIKSVYILVTTSSKIIGLSKKPLRGGTLLFTTKFPEIPGTHFIELGRMKG